jgi:F-type H+-transporting ATPase subunit delta
MTLSAVATRYANALAEVVIAPGSPVQPRQAVEQLYSFAQLLAGSPELHNALTSPAVPPGRKRAVVARLADRLALDRVLRNFLFVLVDHRRIAQAAQIAHAFEVQIDNRLGLARAEVSSAAALSNGQRKLLEAELGRLTGKAVRAHYAVDDALIGGVVAKIGSTVYDGSVRGQLQALRRRLSTEG